MKWMLVVMIFGTQPVKTDLIFDTLDRCLIVRRVDAILSAVGEALRLASSR